jgi:hypothetical protein
LLSGGVAETARHFRSGGGGIQPAEPAAPGVFFLDSSKARSNWISEYVVFDALKLVFAANEVIIALVLPEWLPGQPKQLIRLSSRAALQPSESNRRWNLWCEQQVYMVGHNDPAMQQIIIGRALMNPSYDHVPHRRHSEIDRSNTLFIQQSIHANERLP